MFQIRMGIPEMKSFWDDLLKKCTENTGIAQSDISKIENGSGNPTLKILQRLAEGLGMYLKVEFVPKVSI